MRVPHYARRSLGAGALALALAACANDTGPSDFNAQGTTADMAAAQGAFASAQATSFTAIGASGFGVAKVPLSNTGNGTHAAESSMGFGITVYGYGTYTSYWYPGGLDLTTIPVE